VGWYYLFQFVFSAIFLFSFPIPLCVLFGIELPVPGINVNNLLGKSAAMYS